MPASKYSPGKLVDVEKDTFRELDLPSSVQVYNRIHIQLHTHSQEGTDKISEQDLKMAKFIDKRCTSAVQLDDTALTSPANDVLGQLLSLRIAIPDKASSSD